MPRKERFNVAGAGRPEPRDADPPSSAARHAQGQVGQRADARCMQRQDEPNRQPALDGVADERLWKRHPAQRFDGNCGGLGEFPIGRTDRCECGGQVPLGTARREGHELSFHLPDERTRRSAVGPAVGQIAIYACAAGHALKPGPERGQRGLVGPSEVLGRPGWRGQRVFNGSKFSLTAWLPS